MNSSNNNIIMSDNVIILKNCSVGLRSCCNTYCLQPYTTLFVWQQPYTLPFLEVFIVTCFLHFLIIWHSVISWKMGKRLGVNWLKVLSDEFLIFFLQLI